MSNRLNEANPAESRGLDLLADIIRGSHTGTISARGWYAGNWALEFEVGRDRGFHIVTAGRIHLRLGDGTTHMLEPGDVVLVGTPHVLATDLDRAPIPFDPALAHTFAVDEPDGETCLVCGAYQLSDPDRHPIFRSLPPLIRLPAGERHSSIDAVIELLDAELQSDAPGSRTIAARLIDAMFIYILRHWIGSDCPHALGWMRALRDPTLARALALIHRHYARPWTLDTLARAAGTSRASLARHFTAEVGTSPMQFLTRRRLDVAQELLSGSMSLDEIAAEVGYASAFSLSKAYKRTFGESPRHHVTAAGIQLP